MSLLVLGFAAALTATVPQDFASWTEPMEPFELADDFYYVGSAGLAAYLIPSDDGHILIDAPMEENVEMLLDNIRTAGFDPSDIRTLVASHAHFDHVGGVAGVLAATGAELALSAKDAEAVRYGGSRGVQVGPAYPPADAGRILDHGSTVSVGGRSLTAHLTPGHTSGCTSWSGDVVIDGEELTFVSVCSLSVLGQYRLLGDEETYPGIARDYCTSVTYLKTLSPDVFLAPHGSLFGMADKLAALRAGNARAFVDPSGYAAYLEGVQRSVESRLADEGHAGGCAALLGGDG